jgi:hypothetical protein
MCDIHKIYQDANESGEIEDERREDADTAAHKPMDVRTQVRMCVCVCVYIYIYIYVCMYVCYKCVCLHICVHMIQTQQIQ